MSLESLQVKAVENGLPIVTGQDRVDRVRSIRRQQDVVTDAPRLVTSVILYIPDLSGDKIAIAHVSDLCASDSQSILDEYFGSMIQTADEGMLAIRNSSMS